MGRLPSRLPTVRSGLLTRWQLVVSCCGVALKTSHVVNGQAVCASVFGRAWSAGGAIEVTDRVRLLVLVGCAEGASVSGWAWWAGGLREVTGSGRGARKALFSS